jgi:hypothetical protein
MLLGRDISSWPPLSLLREVASLALLVIVLSVNAPRVCLKYQVVSEPGHLVRIATTVRRWALLTWRSHFVN